MYLVNEGLLENEWEIKCIKFAPNTHNKILLRIFVYMEKRERKSFSFITIITIFDEAIQIFKTTFSLCPVSFCRFRTATSPYAMKTLRISGAIILSRSDGKLPLSFRKAPAQA